MAKRRAAGKLHLELRDDQDPTTLLRAIAEVYRATDLHVVVDRRPSAEPVQTIQGEQLEERGRVQIGEALDRQDAEARARTEESGPPPATNREERRAAVDEGRRWMASGRWSKWGKLSWRILSNADRIAEFGERIHGWLYGPG